MAGDRLGIGGAADIDAFVHAEKGEIIIIEVHTVPDLTQDWVELQQVTAWCINIPCVNHSLQHGKVLGNSSMLNTRLHIPLLIVYVLK